MKLSIKSLRVVLGRVDSFFTLVNRAGMDKNGELNAIIPIWGFDIPLSKPEEFKWW